MTKHGGRQTGSVTKHALIIGRSVPCPPGDERAGFTLAKKQADAAALRNGQVVVVPGPYSHGGALPLWEPTG
jgi:hypothetical protein